jgi:hypothetical protein
MLENNYVGMEPEQTAKSGQRCKPDYEAMIKRARIQLARATVFRDAALYYFEGSTVRGPMAELIGELVMTCRVHEKTINELIVRQESEKD